MHSIDNDHLNEANAARTPDTNTGSELYRYSPEQANKKSSGGYMKKISLTLFAIVLIAASVLAYQSAGVNREISQPYRSNREPGDIFPSVTRYPVVVASLPKAPLGSGVTIELAAVPEGGVLTKQEVYAKCSPWVVAVSASASGGGYYWGSGVIMAPDGYILTNNHIIEDSASVTITLWDDSEYEAKLVGADLRSDIAVLKIEAENLPSAQFGDSSFLQVGDDVLAIGNPLGKEFRSTLTNGIISSISRDVRFENFTMNVLQTTAAVNEGNSGGPLINMYGQIIGITNMKMVSYSVSIEGIAFAIPSSSIKFVVDELIENGFVSGRPAIGITPSGISPKSMDRALPDGLYVQSVNTNSDAYKKGVEAGDIIVAAQGIAVTSALELNNVKDLLRVGDVIILTIYRNGETLDLEIVLCDMADLETQG